MNLSNSFRAPPASTGFARGLWAAGALLLALLGTLLAATSAWADPPGRVGRVADVTGTVLRWDPETGSWEPALRNLPLTTRDRLRSQRESRGDVQIGSSRVLMAAETELGFESLDDDRVAVELQAGSLALAIRSAEVAREFEILTAEGRVRPLGEALVRVDREPVQGQRPGATWITVSRGAVRFEGPDSALEVRAGQRAELWRADGATNYRWLPPAPDAFSAWVSEQDRNLLAYTPRYTPSELPGADELDRHGRWDSHPEYGSVWWPSRVSIGWEPYRDGRWIWRSPWGWTWVDDMPWGFATAHYGRWLRWGVRWVWVPGVYVARPVYAPGLVTWVGGGVPGVHIDVRVGVRPPPPPPGSWLVLPPREPYRPPYRHSPTYVQQINITQIKVQERPGQRWGEVVRSERVERGDRPGDRGERGERPAERSPERSTGWTVRSDGTRVVGEGNRNLPGPVLSTPPSPPATMPASPASPATPGTPVIVPVQPPPLAGSNGVSGPGRIDARERFDRPDRLERPDRIERFERQERIERPERSDRWERTERGPSVLPGAPGPSMAPAPAMTPPPMRVERPMPAAPERSARPERETGGSGRRGPEREGRDRERER